MNKMLVLILPIAFVASVARSDDGTLFHYERSAAVDGEDGKDLHHQQGRDSVAEMMFEPITTAGFTTSPHTDATPSSATVVASDTTVPATSTTTVSPLTGTAPSSTTAATTGVPPPTTTASTPTSTESSTTTTPSCTVNITSDTDKICKECKGKHAIIPRKFFVWLNATGTPEGGTYEWYSPTNGGGGGEVTLQKVTQRSKIKVGPKSKSETKEDVEVKVEYTVNDVTCHDVKSLTVVEPASVRKADVYTFILQGMNRGRVDTEISKVNEEGGVSTVELENLDEDVLKFARSTGCLGKYGVLQVRYYKVLDQFQDLWKCDGNIHEVIKPLTSVEGKVVVGGGKVTQGLAQPDKIYQCDAKSSGFETIKLHQTLSVSGCPVGEREIEITETSVTVTPDT